MIACFVYAFRYFRRDLGLPLGRALRSAWREARKGWTMDDHSISWASVAYVALGSGAAGYLLGAASTALVLGLLRALRKKES